MSDDELQDLKFRLREFAEERDWEQFAVQGSTNAAGGRTPRAATVIKRNRYQFRRMRSQYVR
jgi:hypothetical protein